MVRLAGTLLLSLPLTLTSFSFVAAQTPGFELDHFFVAVSGPESGTSVLEEAGFLVGASNPHPGQGTESHGILFENAYLELIWLTDPEEAESPAIRRTRLARRVDPGAGACPFGIGLRKKGEAEPRFSFETWEYRPPYLPEGVSFSMGTNSKDLEEPLVFFMPWIPGPMGSPPEHANGTRRVTRLEIVVVESVLDSKTLEALSGAGVASFLGGPEYLMELELDDGRSEESLDFRPEIPLRIRW